MWHTFCAPYNFNQFGPPCKHAVCYIICDELCRWLDSAGKQRSSGSGRIRKQISSQRVHRKYRIYMYTLSRKNALGKFATNLSNIDRFRNLFNSAKNDTIWYNNYACRFSPLVTSWKQNFKIWQKFQSEYDRTPIILDLVDDANTWLVHTLISDATDLIIYRFHSLGCLEATDLELRSSFCWI